MALIDLVNEFIPPRQFNYSGNSITDMFFMSENEFYTIGENHFSFFTVDTLKATEIN